MNAVKRLTRVYFTGFMAFLCERDTLARTERQTKEAMDSGSGAGEDKLEEEEVATKEVVDVMVKDDLADAQREATAEDGTRKSARKCQKPEKYRPPTLKDSNIAKKIGLGDAVSKAQQVSPRDPPFSPI